MTEAIVETNRATIPILTADELRERGRRGLAEARRMLGEIEQVPLARATPETILDAWDQVTILLEDAFGPISLLNSVHPGKDVRDAGDDALIEESVFVTELFQNEQLYDRVRIVDPRSPAQRRLRKDLLEAFEDSGV